MDNFSEVIAIIEAGLEGDHEKLVAYANLLSNKVEGRQAQMIRDRLSGDYKNQPKVGFA